MRERGRGGDEHYLFRALEYHPFERNNDKIASYKAATTRTLISAIIDFHIWR